ncbi:AAA family ATPase [Arthrobacter sp. NPDC090010]|uniref:AAA family ATPase n=1 Tax=Arthrobacter sp. NPDC090010 TaxID=3363942 RepID=UPI0037FF75AD
MHWAEYPIRRVEQEPDHPAPRGEWPATLPAVAQLLNSGLDLGPATVFVGDNGTGKSTLVEAIALSYGFNPEGGSTGAQHSTRASESPLNQHLRLIRNAGTTRRGYFLRAEAMHGFFTYLERNPRLGGAEPRFHDLSHGESFLALAEERFRGAGLWILDEPESALSLSGCMALLGILKDLLSNGDSQVILSTHSPLLAALPGATIYEVGPWGLRQESWDDLDLVRNWKSFLNEPQRYLRHL